MNRPLRRIIGRYFVTYLFIALVVLIVMAPAFIGMMTSTRNAYLGEHEQLLKSNLNRLSRELYAIDLFVTSLLESDDVVHMAHLPDENH